MSIEQLTAIAIEYQLIADDINAAPALSKSAARLQGMALGLAVSGSGTALTIFKGYADAEAVVLKNEGVDPEILLAPAVQLFESSEAFAAHKDAEKRIAGQEEDNDNLSTDRIAFSKKMIEEVIQRAQARQQEIQEDGSSIEDTFELLGMHIAGQVMWTSLYSSSGIERLEAIRNSVERCSNVFSATESISRGIDSSLSQFNSGMEFLEMFGDI